MQMAKDDFNPRDDVEETVVPSNLISKTLKERGGVYGDPKINLQCTADLWSVYISYKFCFPINLSAHDVANLMCMLKDGRIITGKYHKDNYLDKSGYNQIAADLAAAEGN